MGTGGVAFVVNPASASGATGRRWPEIERRAARAGLRGDALVSQRPGDIRELARRAAEEQVALVVAVGGDGTVNEAVNGLASAPGPRRPELAVIPRGTGTDFVRTYRIPTALDAALAVALRGGTREIDLGHVSYAAPGGGRAESYFANVGSAGMSGAVARRANSAPKALGGRATFFLALVAVFAGWRNVEMTIELEADRRTGKMTNVIVANGAYHAGGMRLAPEARPDDGLFDVLLIGDITKADFVRNVARVYRGTHLTHPKIELVRAVSVSVDASVAMPIELDGEQPGTTPARFELRPRALRLRVPR